MLSHTHTIKSIALLSIILFGKILIAGNDDQSAVTSIPRSMSYQGILTDSDSNPVPDDTYNITFGIYNGETSSIPLWILMLPCVTSGGYFSAVLNDINLPFDEDYWLELQLEGETAPMVPRQKINMSAYAAKADASDYAVDADKLDGSHASDFAGITHSHDQEYVNEGQPNSITNVMIDNDAVTGLKIENSSILFDDIGQNGATTGQVMKWNGIAWIASYDDIGYGDSDWIMEGDDMYSANAGNIGIGVSTPVHKLHVNGSLFANTVNTGYGAYELFAMDQNVRTTDAPTFNRLYLNDYGYAIGGFHVGGSGDPGTDNLIVDGSLGIGNAPLNKLDINGDARVRGGDILDNAGISRISFTEDDNLTLRDGSGDPALDINISGLVGIGTQLPSALLHVESPYSSAVRIRANFPANSISALYVDFQNAVASSGFAIYGDAGYLDSYGVGGGFSGGYIGATGSVQATGSNYYYGLYGYVAGGSGVNHAVYGTAQGSGVNYGVYGRWLANGGTGYGVYFENGLAGSGTKSCVVKTSQGPTLLYCQESPENWFEDFGQGQLQNGNAHIDLDPLFLETVTISDQAPMKVFVQLEGDCYGVFVSKGTSGFDVIELQKGTSDAPFSYRVVAKRKGYEGRRLDYTEAGLKDTFLYPESEDQRLKEIIPTGKSR